MSLSWGKKSRKSKCSKKSTTVCKSGSEVRARIGHGGAELPQHSPRLLHQQVLGHNCPNSCTATAADEKHLPCKADTRGTHTLPTLESLVRSPAVFFIRSDLDTNSEKQFTQMNKVCFNVAGLQASLHTDTG